MNKFKAVPVIKHGIKFDSGLELKVYEILLKLTKPTLINCHKPIIVKPQGTKYKELAWKCDFQLIRLNQEPLYIEAKGKPTRDFKLTMQMLDYFNPDVFNNLVLVSYEAKTIDYKLKAIGIDDLEKTIRGKL